MTEVSVGLVRIFLYRVALSLFRVMRGGGHGQQGEHRPAQGGCPQVSVTRSHQDMHRGILPGKGICNKPCQLAQLHIIFSQSLVLSTKHWCKIFTLGYLRIVRHRDKTNSSRRFWQGLVKNCILLARRKWFSSRLLQNFILLAQIDTQDLDTSACVPKQWNKIITLC